MSRTPFMPFYPDAYLADTAQLTLEEQGAYMRLLCYLWITTKLLPECWVFM
jgi:uncharacterized protein YdaU (DUF1376 family)